MFNINIKRRLTAFAVRADQYSCQCAAYFSFPHISITTISFVYKNALGIRRSFERAKYIILHKKPFCCAQPLCSTWPRGSCSLFS